MERVIRFVLLGVGVALAAACAPMQRVPMAVGPEPVEVYVDGERLAEPLPAELDLKADRGHVVMVKKQGHRAQQVILRSVEQAEGPPQLEPARVVVELRREARDGGRIEVELDPAPPAEPGTPAAPRSE